MTFQKKRFAAALALLTGLTAIPAAAQPFPGPDWRRPPYWHPAPPPRHWHGRGPGVAAPLAAGAVGLVAGLAIGSYVASLPPHPRTIVVENAPAPLYYAGGAYYMPVANRYQVVAPPTYGALPPGAQPVTVHGITYYVANNSWFMPLAAPAGGVVYQLVPSPAG